jgi:hypothetical protein
LTGLGARIIKIVPASPTTAAYKNPHVALV